MEIEAKFAVPNAETFEKLLAASDLAGLTYGQARIKQVHDRYLDTAGQVLLRGGFACRLRVSGKGRVATLKSLTPPDGALHSRVELEVRLPVDGDETIQTWPASEAKTLAEQLAGNRPLLPLVDVYQKRHVVPLLKAGESVIELSLDQVRLGGPDAPFFFEVEAELRPEGDLADLEGVIEALKGAWGLAAESLSKFERGLALGRPELAAALKSAGKEKSDGESG